jgi:hypothetical protein
MDEKTKKLVEGIVLAYRDLFPREYELAAEGNKQRAKTQETKWGEVTNSDILEREELRMPSSLHTALYLKMTPAQQQEFESDKGILWFQRRFPEWVPNTKID